MQRRKPESFGALESAIRTFNGAAALQRRKQYSRPAVLSWRCRPSMGPPLCSDGNQAEAQLSDLCKRDLQWGRRFAATETGQRTQARKPIRCLQWGRRFAATETRIRSASRPGTAGPSMGPPLCSDGNPRSPARSSVVNDAFNGAAALQRRKQCGPEFFGACPELLQWGRRFAATETIVMPVPDADVILPSMGPPLCSDGNDHGRLPQQFLQFPFNGAAALQRRKPAGPH